MKQNGSFGYAAPPYSPVGGTIPALTPHAVSVSLPKWQDNVDYEEGHERIKQSMTSGYPRFYIHHQIDQLAQITAARFGLPTELCILLPTQKTADSCHTFLTDRSSPVSSRIVAFPIRSASSTAASSDPDEAAKQRTITVYACFFPAEDFPVAKQFWQHTGDGISSRVGERCLTLLGVVDGDCSATAGTTPTPPEPVHEAVPIVLKGGRYATKNKHYGAARTTSTSSSTSTAATPTSPTLASAPLLPSSSKLRYATSKPLTRNPSQSDESEPTSLANSLELPSRNGTANGAGLARIEQDEDVLARYVEERYGRNLDLSLAPLAKLAMRRRIAGVLRETPGQAVPVERIEKEQAEDSDRGVVGLTESGVWLYPCGMSAIFHAHQLVMGARKRVGGEVGQSACFGFPYTDTLKILEKWGPGCHFLGHGLTSDLPALRALAEKASPPLLAVFCEFPSNPLLRSPPLAGLRALADEFGFMIVVDETIAGFVNVEVLPLADVVVSSLTKVFSGDSNVMGGSLVINPKSPHYAALRATQDAEYEDMYFDEDAIYMERNSRNFQDRIAEENANAEMICDLLRTRRAHGPVPPGVIPAATSTSPSVIKEVYYPKFMTPEHYLASLRPPNAALPNSSGFGALFSLTFTSLTASKAFFDALGCYKGPSLGTNFTIACPYTILAHYTETEWALGWGVEAGLVRISIGLEEPELLREWIDIALEAAEKAVEAEKAQQ
ncbi:hypothetical protein RQP46_006926 [Phenoliferia psychrophenolica]